MKKIYLILPMVTVLFCSALSACSSTDYEFNAPNLPDEFNAPDLPNETGSSTDYKFNAPDLPDETVCYPQSAGGKTYYVAADGKKGAAGTEDDPVPLSDVTWNQKELKGGDSILFKRGDTFEGRLRLENVSGEKGNPITIASYGDSDKKPVIKSHQEKNGQDVPGIALYKCSNIVVRDLEVWVDGSIRTSESHSGGFGGIVASYSYTEEKYQNVWIVNNTVHAADPNVNATGIVVDVSEDSLEATPDDNVLTGVWVTGNTVYDMGRNGIQISGWLKNSKNGDHNQKKRTVYKNAHADGNTVYNVGACGIFIGCATNSSMNRNLVHNTGNFDLGGHEEGVEKDSAGGAGSGIMAVSDDTCEIMYNEVYEIHYQNYDYDAMGIQIDWNNKNCTVQYNHCYNCDGGGISSMATHGSKILNNRVENNRNETLGQYGQISVNNATSLGGAEALPNPQDVLLFENVEIANNLLLTNLPANPKLAPHDALALFSITNCYNPGTTYNKTITAPKHMWINDVFRDNHLVYTGEGNDFYFNYVGGERDYIKEGAMWVEWDKFERNKYYAKDISSFRAYDNTLIPGYDVEKGWHWSKAQAELRYVDSFERWKNEREQDATFEVYDPEAAPSKPERAKASFKKGNLTLSWEASEGDVWHYNVFRCAEEEEMNYHTEEEEMNYRNLIGQTETNSFTFRPEEKGVFYLFVRPESNTGVLGDALKIRIELK